MPYLQLDVPRSYQVEVKRRLAERLGQLFADIMQTRPDKVVVAFRELGQGNLWRCGEGGPRPGAVLKCDIRGGRPVEQRRQLAEALVDACEKALGLEPDDFSLEFTQHAGDEIFEPGRGFAADWTPQEASSQV
jgi:phenylpyruvate tautomerase PptA (4-oxalocrotonate tautomerase family)